jgi:hypothetical protein
MFLCQHTNQLTHLQSFVWFEYEWLKATDLAAFVTWYIAKHVLCLTVCEYFALRHATIAVVRILCISRLLAHSLDG